MNNRVLLKKIINLPGNNYEINADNIVYNSMYFRYYNQPVKGLPLEISKSEFTLITVNFKFELTEKDVPIENDPLHSVGVGYQLCFCLNGQIYYRTFSVHNQKYLQWKKITSVVI